MSNIEEFRSGRDYTMPAIEARIAELQKRRRPEGLPSETDKDRLVSFI